MAQAWVRKRKEVCPFCTQKQVCARIMDRGAKEQQYCCRRCTEKWVQQLEKNTLNAKK